MNRQEKTLFVNLKPIAAFILSLGLTLAVQSASATQPIVICGNEDPAGNTEIDNITVYRGGNPENQLVLRNRNIINDFLSKGAICEGELNSNHEFILMGLGDNSSVRGNINNRYIEFFADGDGYTLTVRLVGDDHYTLVRTLASFHFSNDCQQVGRIDY